MPLIIVPFSLPAASQFTPTVEYRARLERRTDRDFNANQNDNRTDLFQRYRLGVGYSLSSDSKLYAQYQYAHDLGWSASGNGSSDMSDLFQGYFESTKVFGGDLKVGRQIINITDQRLFDESNWGNGGRTFDAARLTTPDFDVFGGKLGVQTNNSQQARVAAAIAITKNWGRFGVWFKHDSVATGAEDIWTVNHEGAYTWPGLRLETNLAYQRGHNNGLDQNAWAIHLRGIHKLTDRSQLMLDVDSASGGSNGGTNFTFDPMYPSGHSFCGIMDLQSWRNVDVLALAYQYNCTPDQMLRVRAITSELRDPSDGWYQSNLSLSKSGAISFRDPTGASGRDLGRELDLEYSKNLTKQAQFLAGVGFFFPGTFVKNISGDSRAQMYTYLTFQAKF